MRRWTVVAAAAVLVATGCRDDGGADEHGLRRSNDPVFDVAGFPARVAVLVAADRRAPWLAAGDAPDGQAGRVATLWRSRDALAWDGTPLPGGEGAMVRGAARQGDVLVLVGDRDTGGGGSGGRGPVVWVARGEGDPTPVPGGLPVGGGTVVVRQVVGGVGGAGFLALGTVDGRVALWRSADGVSWARVPGVEEAFGPSSAVAQLASTATGAVAVGAEGSAPSAWSSSDGLRWSRAPFGGEASAGRLTSVAAGPDGFLGAGSVTPSPAGRGLARRPAAAVWRSTDGRSWEPVPAIFDPGPQPGGDPLGTEIKALVRTDDGYVASGGGEQARRVWFSVDGRTWTDADLPGPARAATRLDLTLLASDGADVLVGSSAEIFPPRLLLQRQGRWMDATVATPFSTPRPVAVETGVIATDEGFVLWANLLDAGTALADEGGEARLWLSPDGRQWRPLSGSSAFDLSNVSAMAADAEEGLVAVGSQPAVAPVVSRGVAHVRTWVSSDGDSWLPDDAPFRDEPHPQVLSGVAGRGGRFVAVGTRTLPGTDFDAIFWARAGTGPWRPLEDVPSSAGEGTAGASGVCAAEPGWVALGTGSDAPVAWSSADGEGWQPVDDSSLAASGAAIRSCIGVGGRLLAVGSARASDGDRQAGAWTSADGRRWSRSASPALQGDLDLRIDRVAAQGDDVVAVGVEGDGANRPIAMWRSSDCGGSWDRAAVDERLFAFTREREVTGVAVGEGMVVLTGVVDGGVGVWTIPLSDLPGAGAGGGDCRS